MPLDSIFDYLRRCKGQDFLTFATAEAAAHARDVLLEQFAADGIDTSKRPSIDQFDTQLRLRLKEVPRANDASEPLAEVRR